MRHSSLLLAALAALVGLALPSAAGATAIRYEAVDLADTTPGEDLWLYRYRVEDAAFAAGHGFSVFFDLGLYEQIAAAPAPNTEWDVLAIQPDAALLSDGFYDALALVANASLADLFEVSFVWLGAGAPGAQRFDVYDAQFQTVERGQTVPIPEPATLAACGLGIALLAIKRRV